MPLTRAIEDDDGTFLVDTWLNRHCNWRNAAHSYPGTIVRGAALRN
jgi:hypothetical protein